MYRPAANVCQREECKGSLRRNILNDMKEILRVVLHEQCFYYRLKRIFEKAEVDEPKIHVLRRKTQRVYLICACACELVKWQCVCAYQRDCIDESGALCYINRQSHHFHSPC